MNPRLLKLLQPPLLLARPGLARPAFPSPAIVELRPGATTPTWLATGRSRPRYFDGRFLAARDLVRDQQYLDARGAEYLRASGPGIVHGLRVTRRDQETLTIAPGAAITAGGRLVVIRDQRVVTGSTTAPPGVDVRLSDAAATQRLDRELGLLARPRAVWRRGTGVYALLARPVEYTANPIGSYPASIEERRRPEDGEVIQAVAFTLVPFHDPDLDVALPRQRAALARRLFVERADHGLPVEAVPLAMIQLEHGFIHWVDSWLVRRELGDAYDGAGARKRGPRAIAEAHVQHYHDHLDAILAARTAPDRQLFAATDELAALPPVGRYPPAALDLIRRTDAFFPPGTPITFQLAPLDELPIIADEALALPPIDLGADPRSLAVTPVAIVLGVPRTDAESFGPELRRFELRAAALAGGAVPAGTGATERLFALYRRGVAAGTAVPYFVRQRRAIGDTEEGVLTVEQQDLG